MERGTHNSASSKSTPLCLALSEAGDVALVGGKAASLGEMLRAGLPVPGGFVVTTAAYRAVQGRDEIPPDLADEIARHYRSMGSGLVAVRSSATGVRETSRRGGPPR